MKSLFFLLILFSYSSFATNAGIQNNIDLCEERIKTVREDLKKWMQEGGPRGLTLPINISVDLYSKAMSEQTNKAKIKCVGIEEEGFPVEIDGTSKVCRFDKLGKKSFIKCDRQQFLKLSETDQYVLIHHEYAGLAQIEIPNGDDSNYSVSNQISAYLADMVVKKLSIHPIQKTETCIETALASITIQGNNLLTKPTISPIEGIVSLANSCKNQQVKLRAAAVLAMAVSSGDLIKMSSVGLVFENFCRNDVPCATVVIGILANSFIQGVYEIGTTVDGIIYKVVKSAPTPEVINKAISVLTKGCSNDPSVSVGCNISIRALNSMKMEK